MVTLRDMFEKMKQVNVNKKIVVVLLFLLIAVVTYLLCSMRFTQKHTWSLLSSTSHIQYSQEWTKKCLNKNIEFNIKHLSEIRDEWKLTSNTDCGFLYKKFTDIYYIEKNPAPLKLPEPFIVKVKGWLNNDEALFQEIYKQEVTQVFNEWTKENTIFNPLREKRPISKPTEPEKEYVERLVKESEKSCDFCNYKESTAEDTFGRLESLYSYTASNAFKLEKYHALFALKTHHPHNWQLNQYMDMMNLTLKWFDATQKDDPTFCCPEIVWDILPRAGASQVHPHMHGLMGKHRYHGEAEKLRQAALLYKREKGSDYFLDLIDVHSALGLLVRHNDAVALANLTPIKDHEIMIIARRPSKAFFEMIYIVLRAFIDDLEKLAISSGIALPPMDKSEPMPAFARIVTRGAVASVRSDISSLELFSGTNVNIDPFKVIETVKASLNKYTTKPV